MDTVVGVLCSPFSTYKQKMNFIELKSCGNKLNKFQGNLNFYITYLVRGTSLD